MPDQSTRLPTRLVCPVCEKDFPISSAHYKRGSRCCSPKCAGVYRRVYSAPARFWAKVNKNGPIPSHCPDLGPCWIWTGHVKENGYGRIMFGGRRRYTHVIAYILTYGDPPDDKPYILHRCDGGNIACARPDHLFPGTIADNVRDCRAKGRGTFGERSGAAKLTATDIRAIRARYIPRRVSQRVLAREYGVAHSLIGGIVRRQGWKHVK